MAHERRTVRVAREVFDELDRVLGPERGPNGEPSVNGFLTSDLLPIVDAFATGFDNLPEAVPGRPDYRMLIAAGLLVGGVSVIGQLTGDGSLELVYLRLDLDTPREEWEWEAPFFCDDRDSRLGLRWSATTLTQPSLQDATMLSQNPVSRSRFRPAETLSIPRRVGLTRQFSNRPS